MNICLTKMTKDLCRTFMQEFVPDIDLFENPNAYKPYVYDQHGCDAYFERHQRLGRIHMAIMLGSEPIGEIVLKNIDFGRKCCTMGITMKNDTYKGKGYGTQGEILAIDYATKTLGLETVYADALIHNTRSQHVLEKVGFTKTHQDETFVYFRYDKSKQDSRNQTVHTSVD